MQCTLGTAPKPPANVVWIAIDFLDTILLTKIVEGGEPRQLPIKAHPRPRRIAGNIFSVSVLHFLPNFIDWKYV